eukprot:1457780-Prymnesium_polylepis.1
MDGCAGTWRGESPKPHHKAKGGAPAANPRTGKGKPPTCEIASVARMLRRGRPVWSWGRRRRRGQGCRGTV